MPSSDPRCIPDEVRRLFWDVDPDKVDLTTHADYVMERVMQRGGWVAMQWLRATAPPPQLAAFIRGRGQSVLAPRELAYWSLIAGVEVAIPTGGGRPGWAGE